MNSLEDAAITFFRAIRATGKECLGHEQFGFKLDINIMTPSKDQQIAVSFAAKVQDALTQASQIVQPVIIEGTSVQ